MPIDHQVLLAKLSHFNFSTSALNWMTSHLADRKQCVVVNGVKSPYIDCTTYMDLFCFLCILNADDAVIFTPRRNPVVASQILTTAMAQVQKQKNKNKRCV